MWFSNARQVLQLLIIIFFTFVAFAAADAAWMPWVGVAISCGSFSIVATDRATGGSFVGAEQATLVIFLLMILLADLMFLDNSQFQFNPDYKVRAVEEGFKSRVVPNLFPVALARTGLAPLTPSTDGWRSSGEALASQSAIAVCWVKPGGRIHVCISARGGVADVRTSF